MCLRATRLGKVSCSRNVLQKRAKQLRAAAARQGNRNGLQKHQGRIMVLSESECHACSKVQSTP